MGVWPIKNKSPFLFDILLISHAKINLAAKAKLLFAKLKKLIKILVNQLIVTILQ